MTVSPASSLVAKIREVGVHSSIYAIGSIAQSAVQFLLIPVLTARLAAAAFGAYSLIQLASVFAGGLFYLGVTSAIPRSYFDYDDEHDRRSVFTTGFLLLLAGAIAQVALGSIGAAAISQVLLETPRFAAAVFWAFLGGALAFINQFFFTYLRFLRKSVASIALSIFALAGSLGGSIYLLGHGGGVAAPFQAIAGAQAAVGILFLAFYGRRAFTPALKRNEVSILIKFGIPTIFGSLAALAIDWADRIVIERMLTLTDVGVYSVGYKLGSIVNALVITPFTQIWNPMMFEYRAHPNVGQLFSKIVSYYFLATALVLAATCLFVRNALPLVARSEAYAAAAPIVVLIMTGYLLNGATNIVSAGLFYERRIVTFAVLYYAIAIGNIVLTISLVRAFGIRGAAAASLVTYAVIPITVYWRARRFFAIRFEWWRLTRIAAVVAGPMIFSLFIEAHFPLPFALKAVLFLAVLVLAAAVCTEKGEKEMLSALLRRPAQA